jgi:hypothetical protein
MELELSDEQIRVALAPYESNIPITKDTRPVLLRKIAQLSAGEGGQNVQKASQISPLDHDSISFKERLEKIQVNRSKAGSKPSQGLEKANEFPSVTVPEKNKFRALIENSQVEEFVQSVWANPRYLITQGDSPEVFKIGPRYNALHCAARVGSLEICKKLFEILEGDRYWSLVYPGDSVEIRNKRRGHLIDLYLNTCDKGVSNRVFKLVTLVTSSFCPFIWSVLHLGVWHQKLLPPQSPAMVTKPIFIPVRTVQCYAHWLSTCKIECN